jgi:hypothetical protein
VSARKRVEPGEPAGSLEERYESIAYLNKKSSKPTTYRSPKDKTLDVIEGREGHLGGLLGEGGGWQIRGRLEAEVPTDVGLLQLYSKSSAKWSPGFATIWMEGYDPKKYPIREFRLILRDHQARREIHTLKSVSIPPMAVRSQSNPDGSPVQEFRGRGIPFGKLEYDTTRRVATVQIIGLHDPITFEVSIPASLPTDGKK